MIDCKKKGEKMDTSIAVKAKGLIVSIPVEIFYVRNQKKSELIGKFSLSEENLKIILNEISPLLYEFYLSSPIHEMKLDFNVEAIVFYDTTGKKALLFRNESLEINFMYDSDGYYLLWTWNQSNQGITISFNDFLRAIRELTQATEFNMIVKSQKNVKFDTTLLKYLQSAEKESRIIEQLFLPSSELLKDTTLLAYAQIHLSDLRSEFFKILAKDNTSAIILSAGMGKDNWIQFHIQQMKLMGVTIDLFEILIRLSKTQQLILSGRWKIRMLDNDLILKIQGNVSERTFSFGAGVIFDPPIIFGFATLKSLAFYISVYQGKLCLGGYGQLSIKNFYCFGLLICEIQIEMIDPKAFALALGEMSLPKLASLFVGNIAGIEAFDFLAIESFPLQATKMSTTVFQNISQANYECIQKEFVLHCQGNLGGVNIAPLSSDTMSVMQVDDGWMITDQKSVRHYYIHRDGSIALAPQLYYSTMETEFLDMVLHKGIFICLSIRLFNIKANIYFEAIENQMITALVKICQIETAILTLSSSDFHHSDLWYEAHQPQLLHRNNNHEMCVSVERTPVATFLSQDNKGPFFYLHMEKGRNECYINAKVAVFHLFEIQALVIFDQSQIRIDTSLKLWGFSIIFKIATNYSSFQELSFMIYLKIDTSAFLQLINELVNKVEIAVRAFQDHLRNAQAILNDAQNRVLGLQYQINEIDNQINYYVYELRHLKWYLFFKAPYYLCVIGGLEIAKGALYVAIGVAYAALEIAKRILEGISYVSEGVLQAVKFVAKAIGTIFYIKSLELSFNTSLKGLSASLGIDMTLFGRSIQSQSVLKIEHEQMSSIINKQTHDKAHQCVDKELQGIEVIDDLFSFNDIFKDYGIDPFDYVSSSDRLDSALSYIDSSAEMMGMLDGNYYLYYQEDQPMSQYFDQDMLANMKLSSQHWQGSLKAMEQIDLQPLIDASKGDTSLDMTSIQQEWDTLHDFITLLPAKREALKQKINSFTDSKQLYKQNFENILSGQISQNYDLHIYQIINNPKIVFLSFFDDKNDYYINPTKEPILDYLMLDLLKNSDSSKKDIFIKEVEENIRKKENDHTYTIRIKGENK